MPTILLPDDELRNAIALVRKHGTVTLAAAAAGMSRSTLDRRYRLALLKFPEDANTPVPMSEDEAKFHPEFTAEDCVSELRRIANIDTTKIVTRNYFRNHSKISESTWNRHFGTFAEFKRQAGITLSRHAHRLERDIAKHASVDNKRVMNIAKREWEDKFLRPSSGRWQTAVVCCDQHDLNCDAFYRRVLIDTIRRVQPEKICLNGDVMDMPEFSKHWQDPRSFQLVERVNWLHAFLKDIREASAGSEITYIEGNHEFRLLRHLTEQTPAMLVVLADLHGFTVPRLLGLDSFEVNFIARADLSAWTERDIKQQLRKNYTCFWESQLYGHFPEMRSMGLPGASGHHHKHELWSFYSPKYGPSEWHQIGCGHQREASYCAGERWGNGFLIAHCDTWTHRTQFEYVDVSHPGVMVGGKFYERSAVEPVLDLIPDTRGGRPNALAAPVDA